MSNSASTISVEKVVKLERRPTDKKVYNSESPVCLIDEPIRIPAKKQPKEFTSINHAGALNMFPLIKI